MMAERWQRYRPIVDDWAALMAAVQRPLPTTIWANRLKISGSDLVRLMAAGGVPLRPLPWQTDGFAFPADSLPGLRWEYLAGLYHVQEAVSMLPVRLLEIRPSDRVLDMCAAPGNKTAQISVSLGNRGTVVAVDRNGGRMRAARQTWNRLGLCNITAVTHDAGNLPRRMGLYDKILVDAPCTCEGTCRKDTNVMGRVTERDNHKLARVQQAILRKAVQLCRPGGRIVYATCTFAPEENELVVQKILQEADGRVRLLPAHIPGFVTRPGITQWQGESLDRSLSHCLRIWPHHNDTGGFFIAVMEKERDASTSEEEVIPSVGAQFSDRIEPSPWLETAVSQFGIPASLFAPFTLLRWGRRNVWLVNDDHVPPPNPTPDSIGIPFMGVDGKYPKLSTAASMLCGTYATENMIDLTAVQVQAYYARQEFPVTDRQLVGDYGTSRYVLVRYHQYPLGVGVFRAGKNRVESLFPKGWVRESVNIV